MKKILAGMVLTLVFLLPAQVVMADAHFPLIERMMSIEMKMTDVMMKMMKAGKMPMKKEEKEKLMKILDQLDEQLKQLLQTGMGG